jgi:hypothetical protein
MLGNLVESVTTQLMLLRIHTDNYEDSTALTITLFILISLFELAGIFIEDNADLAACWFVTWPRVFSMVWAELVLRGIFADESEGFASHAVRFRLLIRGS